MPTAVSLLVWKPKSRHNGVAHPGLIVRMIWTWPQCPPSPSLYQKHKSSCILLSCMKKRQSWTSSLQHVTTARKRLWACGNCRPCFRSRGGWSWSSFEVRSRDEGIKQSLGISLPWCLSDHRESMANFSVSSRTSTLQIFHEMRKTLGFFWESIHAWNYYVFIRVGSGIDEEIFGLFGV